MLTSSNGISSGESVATSKLQLVEFDWLPGEGTGGTGL